MPPSQSDGDRELVERHLAGLDADELRRRLLALLGRDDAFRLALVTEARAASGAFDLAELKKQVTAQLKISTRHLSWRGSAEYAQEAERALDLLDGLLDGGQPEAVVALAEHAMKRFDTALARLDDSGGYLALPIQRLSEIHLRACQAARPEPRRLGVRLVEHALATPWDWFHDAPVTYKDVLGEEGLDAYRKRLDREWEQLPALAPDPSRTGGYWHRGDRYKVTHLRENLARASGSVDELVSVLAHDLSSAHQFDRIATELEAAGREREALAWLERGVRESGTRADPRLRDHLVEAYLRDGQLDDALALAERVFAEHPTANTYDVLRLAHSAADGWPERRPGALDALRAGPHVRHGLGQDEAIHAQLAEDDLDGAWADAVAGGCRDDTWLELARRVGATRPDDAVGVYRRLVSGALEDTSNYKRAVKLLVEWRDVLATAGRVDELQTDLARIREENKRRPKLLSMIDKAKLGVA